MREEQLPLVRKFYKASRYSPKTDKQDEVYVLRQSETNMIIGAVRLAKLDKYLILRSMVISPQERGQGYGSDMLRQLSSHLKNRECWCFPFSWLYDFYAQEGFELVSKENAPPQIRDKFIQYTKHGKQLGIMRRSA